MKKIFRLLIISVLFFTAATPVYSKGVYILCYHAFLEKKDPYSFTSNQFKEQLERLKNNGFKFVAFEDIINDRIEGNKNILVSVDDGNKSAYQAYFGVIKPMGIKPLLAIYPAIINRMNYAMTWEQVKELSDEGCYIASHGYHHMFLSEKYYKSDQTGFKKEIYLSKKILEEKLNKKIETMVYPFGVYSDIAVSELKNAGYKYGMTIEPKMEGLPINNNFQIHRYLMTKPAQKDIIARISKQAENSQINSNRNGNYIEKKETAPEISDKMNKIDNMNSMNNMSTVNDNMNTAKNMNSMSTVNNINKKSIIYYPERIKQIISEDAFVPAQKEIKKADINPKFKPFVHKSETSAQLKKNKKEVTEKKNRKKKRQA